MAIIVVSTILLLTLAIGIGRLSRIAEGNRALVAEMRVVRQALEGHQPSGQIPGSDDLLLGQVLEIEDKLEEIVVRLDALLDHFGTSADAFMKRREVEAAVEVRSYLSANPGNTIGAMKLYRDATRKDLKQVMEFVKSVATELGQSRDSD